jgi:hypothetical protein
MEWIREHLLPHRGRELPMELRDASHRIANETQALRGEVVRAVGGQRHYERRRAELKETMDQLLERIRQ